MKGSHRATELHFLYSEEAEVKSDTMKLLSIEKNKAHKKLKIQKMEKIHSKFRDTSLNVENIINEEEAVHAEKD